MSVIASVCNSQVSARRELNVTERSCRAYLQDMQTIKLHIQPMSKWDLKFYGRCEKRGRKEVLFPLFSPIFKKYGDKKRKKFAELHNILQKNKHQALVATKAKEGRGEGVGVVGKTYIKQVSTLLLHL